MPLPNWTSTADWDTLYLAGQALAGIARVDVDLESGLDVQKPKGSQKAAIKDEGAPPAKIKVELEFTFPQLEQFEKQVGLLRPRAVNGSRAPIEAAHPLLKLWGINVVTIGSITSPSPRAGGSFTVQIDMVEWVASPKKIKKPEAKPDDGGDKFFANTDQIMAENAAARNERTQNNLATDDDGNKPLAPSGYKVLPEEET